jgi:hypothetical protein
LQNARSFEAPTEDRSPGSILSLETTQLDRSASPSDVLLLTHPVVKGQSGSPVLALTESGSPTVVVGLVEGRWLRGTALTALRITPNQPADVPGAAIPIRHAISLLDQQHIRWHTSPVF